jgi:hypothetical protein
MYEQLRRPAAKYPGSENAVTRSDTPLQKSVASGAHRLAAILGDEEPDRRMPGAPVQRLEDSTKLSAAGAIGSLGAAVAYGTAGAGLLGAAGAIAAVGGLGYLGYRAFERVRRQRAYRAAFPNATEYVYSASYPHYEASAASGRKLAAAYASWKQRNPEERAIHAKATLAKASTLDDARFRTITNRQGTSVRVQSSSVTGNRIQEAWIADHTGGDLGPYDNQYHGNTGRFSAHYNVKEEDGYGKASPSNSEVIWAQYKRAIAELKMQEKGGLAEIERHNIINVQTNDTIFWSAEGMTNCAGQGTTTIDRSSPDFWPLLGTPNGNSAYWLLDQHGTEFGATDIRNVTYGKGSLIIRYTLERA